MGIWITETIIQMKIKVSMLDSRVIVREVLCLFIKMLEQCATSGSQRNQDIDILSPYIEKQEPNLKQSLITSCLFVLPKGSCCYFYFYIM